MFSHHAIFGTGLQQAVTAPRWLLGRSWGQSSDTLKLEDRFGPEIIADLRRRGHQVEVYPAFSEVTGHSGAIRRHADGVLEAASDPCGDGCAAGI
jgi:gamma-glutamyltranspeptidase/glutathione hydrolase